MNFLTHAAIAIDALDYSGGDRDMAVVGSVAPDLSGRLRIRRAGHMGGMELCYHVKENDPEWMPFAYGLLTHGNNPPAVDAASHGPEGLVTGLVDTLVEKAKDDPAFHKVVRQPVWWHLLAELVSDYMLLKSRPDIIEFIYRAFRSVDLKRAAGLYSGAFSLDAELVETNLARLKAWDLSYYCDSSKYHFIFHRVWSRLKRSEAMTEKAFGNAFIIVVDVLQPGFNDRYEKLKEAAQSAVDMVNGDEKAG